MFIVWTLIRPKRYSSELLKVVWVLEARELKARERVFGDFYENTCCFVSFGIKVCIV